MFPNGRYNDIFTDLSDSACVTELRASCHVIYACVTVSEWGFDRIESYLEWSFTKWVLIAYATFMNFLISYFLTEFISEIYEFSFEIVTNQICSFELGHVFSSSNFKEKGIPVIRLLCSGIHTDNGMLKYWLKKVYLLSSGLPRSQSLRLMLSSNCVYIFNISPSVWMRS